MNENWKMDIEKMSKNEKPKKMLKKHEILTFVTVMVTPISKSLKKLLR